MPFVFGPHLRLRQFYQQLNIFLAILIEGYSVVKEGAHKSQGMVHEIVAIVKHETHRAAQLLGCCLDFISDDVLCHELESFLRSSPITTHQAVDDYLVAARGSKLEVLCRSIRLSFGTIALCIILLAKWAACHYFYFFVCLHSVVHTCGTCAVTVLQF